LEKTTKRKKFMIRSIFWYVNLFLILLCCTQLSKQSTDVREKPRINFKGEIIRPNNKVYEVENITISGLYQQIPLYAVPENKMSDPSEDTTFIELSEISELYPAKANAREALHTFKDRDYIEITVVWKDSKKTTENYIIEATRKILCDTISEAGPIERELSFFALKKLILKGYAYRDREQSLSQKSSKKDTKVRTDNKKQSAARDALCGKVSHLLEDLTAESQKLTPLTDQEKIGKIATDLQESTEPLCS
jgi:hypothetical protein